jgi:hypothetical protein
MPLKILIQLMNGAQLEYSARLWQGKAKYTTHFQKMEQLVLSHFQLSQTEYKVKFIHGDEEERITEIYRSSFANGQLSQEVQAQQIAMILSEENSGYQTVMDNQRYYIENTIVCALVEQREKALDQMMMDLGF